MVAAAPERKYRRLRREAEGFRGPERREASEGLMKSSRIDVSV
jgi:hypothetical protein